jgi:hypothetical protein
MPVVNPTALYRFSLLGERASPFLKPTSCRKLNPKPSESMDNLSLREQICKKQQRNLHGNNLKAA